MSRKYLFPSELFEPNWRLWSFLGVFVVGTVTVATFPVNQIAGYADPFYSPTILIIAIPTLLVYATLDVGTVVLAYSGLAYLGLAVRPPYPDWGFMVAQYQQYLFQAPWLALIPAIIIVIVAAGFSLLGDGLKEALQREVGR